MLGLIWVLREFRPYLYGQRFLEPEGQVAWWLESLTELDFEVEHSVGRLYGNADALSRSSCIQCGRLIEGSACAVQAAKLRPEVATQGYREQLFGAQQAEPEIRLLRQ
ncbi:hypothetical protein T07_11200 [Trichinella nelsoni]|uniref:Uncharacterized protein n=1 Tax=Trichinella nelsoni TaxID=6336 RepID=A0A0V0SF93_9BILA|nr:hypothetical protein T07_11200 [Trichinella nelsoni]